MKGDGRAGTCEGSATGVSRAKLGFSCVRLDPLVGVTDHEDGEAVEEASTIPVPPYNVRD